MIRDEMSLPMVNVHAAVAAATPLPRRIALVGTGPALLRLGEQLADTLTARGESVLVVCNGATASLTTDRCCQAVAEASEPDVVDYRRRLFVIDLRAVGDRLAAGLRSVDGIGWCFEPGDAASFAMVVDACRCTKPRGETSEWGIWLLDPSTRVRPRETTLPERLATEFKVWLDTAALRSCDPRRAGVTRLVHALRGTRVGVVLGGGGARGYAHLGVLRRLAERGVYFDAVAGSSMGALMGLSYAGGYDPAEALPLYHAATTPGRWWRYLPWGRYWHLVAHFRLGWWEKKLRPFLDDAGLEQLPLPLATVAVDLVTGQQVVRERGDAVLATMESINLPVVSRPLRRGGERLVDGSVLNNLPLDVGLSQGVDRLVAVDVVSASRPVRLAHRLRPSRWSSYQTMLRIAEIQADHLSELRSLAADVTLRPATERFAFADFHRGGELLAIGAEAADRAWPELSSMLAELESNAARRLAEAPTARHRAA